MITSLTGGCGTVFTTFGPLSTFSSAPLSEYKEIKENVTLVFQTQIIKNIKE